MRYLKTLLFAAVVAACTGTGAVRYSATAEMSTPELVEVEPGVMVVVDYDQPVFYSEGVYWRYETGTWYRSPYYNRAWVRISAPPVAVRRIQRPEVYVHYRAQVRDHREASAVPPPAPAPMPPSPGPDVRDHRQGPPGPPMTPPGQERREEKRDDKAERHDEKLDRKEEKRDDKAEKRDDKRDDKAEKRDDKRNDKADKHDDKQNDKHKH